VVGDTELLPGGADGTLALEGPRVNDKLELARQMAKDNPAAMAGILRGWVSGTPT
jgi:flagellar M-ring protein FliF